MTSTITKYLQEVPKRKERNQAMPDSRQVATMGSASGALVTALFRARPRAVASVSFLWLFGLFAVFLAPAPVKITPEKLEAYKLKLNDVQSVVKALNAAERRLMDAQFAKDEFTVWFWRFRPEYKAGTVVQAATVVVYFCHISSY